MLAYKAFAPEAAAAGDFDVAAKFVIDRLLMVLIIAPAAAAAARISSIPRKLHHD
jgi:hypothetical protein